MTTRREPERSEGKKEQKRLIYEQTNLRVALITSGHPWILQHRICSWIKRGVETELKTGELMTPKEWVAKMEQIHKTSKFGLWIECQEGKLQAKDMK